MKITAKKVPFSSIVGQSVVLHDEAGKVVCQLAILNPSGEGDYRQRAEKYADLLVSLFSPADRQR